jgi:oligopeptidase A
MSSDRASIHVCRSERLSEHTFGFEEEELKPYFALDNVLDGLFGVCTRLFGVRIERADGEAEVWHPDVGFFKVIDEASGEHLASFFLDPYARPANKRGGAWMGSCVGRSRVLNRKPVAYLTCNGSPPVEGQPSLMTFSEVTTLFHETGHGLQHMLTEVTHAPAAGISGVEWDAVELPSQFMENFCFDEATMYGADGRAGLAKHYQTGQPLPRDLFEKLCKQKTFQAGMGMVRQLNLGALDMALHHRFDPNDASTSPFELQRQIAQTFSVIPPLETDRFLCGFSHIFAGGYSAGYYSYKWAEVLSADAFAAFEEVGLENEEAVRAVGRRFRETVLALGGGTPPAEVFKAFRGREPDPQALLRHSGLL